MVKDRMAVLTAMMDIGLIPIFNHPNAAVGMGANLISKQVLDQQDYAGLEEKVRKTIQLIKTIRGK
jgi:hypothetical protein